MSNASFSLMKSSLNGLKAFFKIFGLTFCFIHLFKSNKDQANMKNQNDLSETLYFCWNKTFFFIIRIKKGTTNSSSVSCQRNFDLHA